MAQGTRMRVAAFVVVALAMTITSGPAEGDVTREEVERAVREGVRCLKQLQNPDGSWRDAGHQVLSGTTSLATLALLSAGEPADSPVVARALSFLRTRPPEQINSTYAVSLQAMVYAAAGRPDDAERIRRNAAWLVASQIKGIGQTRGQGMWTYSMARGRADHSNAQFALLGLHAASEAGVAVPPAVWASSLSAWMASQRRDGSWSYVPGNRVEPSSGSMTCAGISSLIISGLKRDQSHEVLRGQHVEHCGEGAVNLPLDRALDWMARNFDVRRNTGLGIQHRFYYLYGMERAGRLSGQRYFGHHDWYREGAEALVAEQNRVTGAWHGVGFEAHPEIATSLALLFLAKGRSPVLVNKLRHGPARDWDNDWDDARNLVELVARDWKTLLAWQVVDPGVATVEDLLQAPIAYFNGHQAPEFTPEGIAALRAYVDQGGFILAESCCERKTFDNGFRALMKTILPEPECTLHELEEGHPVWRAKHLIEPGSHPLWGVERGCRTIVIYSPGDLSCFWNQAETQPRNPGVIRALQLGQNIIEYATGREIPDDKLALRQVVDAKDETPRRGALRIAKLQHGGEWNVAPLAAARLAMLVKEKHGFDVVFQQKSVPPRAEGLAGYPLVYMHGRGSFTFSDDELDAVRRHLEPGGGTLFADAACGSETFDTAFRAFVKKMLPDHPLVPIPQRDELYSDRMGYDLSESEYTPAAGGRRGFPSLEGIKIDGHWAVIYSKFDLGCALERHQAPDCKGYTPQSARRIALNIVSYSTLP